MAFQELEKNINFSELETRILKLWKENNFFEKSLEKNKNKEQYVFYDGPPFATGLPHYGHILPGTIKDIIPRYQTMKGKYVERRWGWDCHGGRERLCGCLPLFTPDRAALSCGRPSAGDCSVRREIRRPHRRTTAAQIAAMDDSGGACYIG